MPLKSSRFVIKLGLLLTFVSLSLWNAIAATSAIQQAGEDPRTLSALKEAQQAASDLADRLRGLLVKEMKEGGPAGAVKVCSQVGQDIAREISERTGHSVRRVSLGYRNAKDIPDGYEQKKLQEFDQLNRDKKIATEYYDVVKEDGREYLRYLKPLIAAPMCITCHGSKETISADVKAVLAEKYPDDHATGYQAGDVRGAISVKIALPSNSSQ